MKKGLMMLLFAAVAGCTSLNEDLNKMKGVDNNALAQRLANVEQRLAALEQQQQRGK